MKNAFTLLFETIKNEREIHFLNHIQITCFQKEKIKFKKIGEECTEVIAVSKNNDNEELVKEKWDVMYHCFIFY